MSLYPVEHCQGIFNRASRLPHTQSLMLHILSRLSQLCCRPRGSGSSSGAAFLGSSTRPVPTAGFRICGSARHSRDTRAQKRRAPLPVPPLCVPFCPSRWKRSRRAAAVPCAEGASPAVLQLSAFSAVPELRCRTHRAQTPMPAHRRPALAARSSRGGAVGDGGEEAPRAEQRRGWRGWPRCSWVRGATAGGAGAANSSCPSATFRPRPPLSAA